jgi:hypothetical protein
LDITNPRKSEDHKEFPTEYVEMGQLPEFLELKETIRNSLSGGSKRHEHKDHSIRSDSPPQGPKLSASSLKSHHSGDFLTKKENHHNKVDAPQWLQKTKNSDLL